MKRMIGILLVSALMLMAVGCGEEPPAPTQTNGEVVTSTTATAMTQTPIHGEDAPEADTTEYTTEVTTQPTTSVTASSTTTVTTKATTKATSSKKTNVTTKATSQKTQPAVSDASLIVRGATGADEAAVSASRKYRLCDSLFSFPVYVEADGDIRAVDVYELELSFDSGMYTRGDKKGQLGGMSDGEKAVVWIEFPGDFSAWCISYTRTDGTVTELSMYQSGEDGSLVVREGIM